MTSPNSLARIAVSCETNNAIKNRQAHELAQQLGLCFSELRAPDFSYFLVLTEEHLELRQVNSKLKPIYVNFLNPRSDYRRNKGGGKNELIARAVGIKGHYKPRILDATAGLGDDAFILACLGCNVHCLERSAIIAALLQDGLNRLKQVEEFKNLSLSLTIADAITYLRNNEREFFPNVIYLDPMFPPRNKTALVKKEMRILRDLLGSVEDTPALLEAALQHSETRVVVKRPRLAPIIAVGRKPDIVFTGQSIRFDVYLKK